MGRARYPTDLSDRQWRLVEPWLDPPAGRGRPRSVDRRELVDAILYAPRNGVARRALPRDFPPWRTVSHSFRRRRLGGTWERLHDALRDRVRAKDGRAASPSAAILDGQTVKTTAGGGRAATTRGRR